MHHGFFNDAKEEQKNIVFAAISMCCEMQIFTKKRKKNSRKLAISCQELKL